MVINHNMSAMFAQRSQGLTDLSNQKNMEKLSSGMRINRAGDDAEAKNSQRKIFRLGKLQCNLGQLGC